MVGWANEARDRCQPRGGSSFGATPCHRTICRPKALSEFRYVARRRAVRHGRSAAGVFLPPFFPITEAAEVRRPLFVYAFATEALRLCCTRQFDNLTVRSFASFLSPKAFFGRRFRFGVARHQRIGSRAFLYRSAFYERKNCPFACPPKQH